MVTDIVMTTRNRPDYLKRTLDRLSEATRSPYKLHVIDDCSEDGVTRPYLLSLLENGRLASLTLRGERCGLMANKNLSTWLSFSNPFVIAPDDVLVPILQGPDWLARGLSAIVARPQLAILDLNHPGAFRICIEDDGEVVYCEVTGGLFGFMRRAAFEDWHLPHYRENFGYTDDVQRCHQARARGWKVGFLKKVYCYHIGIESAATPGQKYGGPCIEPKDWNTLEPPDDYHDY